MITDLTPAQRVLHTVLTAFGNQCQACEHDDPAMMAQGFVEENWERLEALFKDPPAGLPEDSNFESIEKNLQAMEDHIRSVRDGDADGMIYLSTIAAPKLVWAVREAVAGLFRASEQTGEGQYFAYLRAVRDHLKGWEVPPLAERSEAPPTSSAEGSQP